MSDRSAEIAATTEGIGRSSDGSGEPGTSFEPSAEQLTRLMGLLLEPEGRDLRMRAVHALHGETSALGLG